MNEETIQEFLELVKDLEKLENERSDFLSPNFNIFESAGLVRQEIRHSNILACLLNPDEGHGLDDGLLRQFLNFAVRNSVNPEKPNALQMALADFDDVIVHKEYKRMDIVAWSEKNKMVLVIENKVGASEGDGQLVRYRNELLNEARFREWKKLFVYLTVDGEEPSDKEWWVAMSYSNVLEMLDDVLKRRAAGMGDSARLFVDHYKDLIRRFIVKEVDQELKDACISIYKKHKRVIELILENVDSQGPRHDGFESFLSKNGLVKLNADRSMSMLAFLPRSLMEVIPEVDLTTKNWQGQRRPIIFWFGILKNGNVELVAEVGPWVEGQKRGQLVDALKMETKYPARNSNKSNSEGVYSRVWRCAGKLKNEDADDIEGVMDQLFAEMKSAKVIETVERIALSMWPK